MLFIRDFKIPNRKYYLANIRYYNIDYFLCFYRSICYYLKKQVVIKKKLVNKKKLFNFCYLTLCNIVKKNFEIIK